MAKKKDSDKAAQNGDGSNQPKNDNAGDDSENFSDPEGYEDPITDEGKPLQLPCLCTWSAYALTGAAVLRNLHRLDSQNIQLFLLPFTFF